MRNRILFVTLFCLAIGFIIAYGSPALAQGGEAVRVLRLSDTGFEQAHSVAFSSDGKYLAAGGLSGIYLFDNSQSSSPNFIKTRAWARSVAFVPGTGSLAAGLFDDTVKIWTDRDHQLLRTLAGPQGWVRSISFSKDGRLVAAASDDDLIHVWATEQGSMVLTLGHDIVGIRSVALSPDGRLAAAALGDKTVRVWNVPGGELLYTLTGHKDWVRCVTFSPDGRILASAGFDMTVRLWDMSSGQLSRTLSGHTSSILGLAFSPDGALLASGSTDTTVRLWRVSDGASLQVLRGHTGFVYTVAFSPDGKTLASGASDNSVRLWNVDAWLSMPAPQAVSGPVESTTKDCRLCHHRQGNTAPPRVVELPCEGCHAGGIGQSWCVAFPRSASAGPLAIAYQPVDEVSGVPAGTQGLSVLLASPANGETLYVRGDFMAPEVITGRVYAADPASIGNVKLHLEILAEGQPGQSLNAAPAADGTFRFHVAINPGSPPPHLLKPSTRQCLVCHGDYQPVAGLPVGTVRLIVTATTPDGRQATDERWIRVDSSRDASVPVQVVDAETGNPIPDLSIEASTLLYGWRSRFGSALSGGDGRAQLTLDDSSQTHLSYRLSIPPQVVNGTWYSGASTQVTLEPGVPQSSPVQLQASAQHGEVSGTLHVNGAAPSLSGIKMWAAQWPAGPAFEATAGQAFAFHDLPVGSYLIAPDLAGLAQQGLSAMPQRVDLTQSPHTSLAISLSHARLRSGTVSDADGHPVAFAWVQINGTGSAHAVDPASGQFMLADDPEALSFLTVNAPGFYSQSLHVAPGQKVIDFQLVPEPDVRRIAWGEGQATVPSQSDATVASSHLALNNGWLWGSGTSGSQPLTIDIGSTEITDDAGDFALENAAGQTGWFFLRQGKASVLFAARPTPVEVSAGQMIALVASAAPMPQNETVAWSLHPPLSESPVSEHIQPTLAARLQNWLEKAGIGTLQTITFITYFLSLVALLTIPLFVLFWIRRRSLAVHQEKL